MKQGKTWKFCQEEHDGRASGLSEAIRIAERREGQRRKRKKIYPTNAVSKNSKERSSTLRVDNTEVGKQYNTGKTRDLTSEN